MDFFSTTISDKSIEYVNQVLTSTMISAGKRSDLFEEKLNLKFGFPNPVTLNSGTVTMRLALIAAGIKEGDEVILPAQTFVATGHVIIQCGAKPIFADINLDGNISVESIKQKITEKTKAIIPVHWGGYPCDMDEINQLAKEYELNVKYIINTHSHHDHTVGNEQVKSVFGSKVVAHKLALIEKDIEVVDGGLLRFFCGEGFMVFYACWQVVCGS